MRFINPSSFPSLHTQRNILYLLLQNAETLFAYWHLHKGKIALIEEHYGSDWQSLRPSLRLYDVAGLPFDGTGAHVTKQISVKEQSSCYMAKLRQGRTYVADLGILNHHDQFLPLIRSNPITTPFTDEAVAAASSVDNSSSIRHLLSGGPILPLDHKQFSAYTLYSLRSHTTKKSDSETGDDTL